jgi:transcriptional regulator GlxA family with amidase domain
VFFGSGPGTRNVIKDNSYLDRFKLDPSRQIICSMCSGALIIAALGHLTGLSATTYPTAFEALKSYGVDVLEDKHLVTHGNVGTAAGCLAAVDLVGWAIEKLYDIKIREDVIASVLPIGQGQVCIY